MTVNTEAIKKLEAKDRTQLNVLEIVVLSESNESLKIASAALLEELQERVQWLEFLEQAGVDNWEGWDYAIELREQYEK